MAQRWVPVPLSRRTRPRASSRSRGRYRRASRAGSVRKKRSKERLNTMCGIVGAVAQRNVVPMLVEGLKRLEYRGYDSAGVAVVNGTIRRVRRVGRVAEMESAAKAEDLNGFLGIGHTR